METQEQKFTRELADSRMQIELLRNQVLLRYYAQLLELDIMQHPKEVKTLMSSINTLERYARKYTPKDSAEVTPVPNEPQPMTNRKETATNTVPHEGEKTETIEPKKIQNTAVAKPTPHMPVEPPHLSSVTNFPEGIKIKKLSIEVKHTENNLRGKTQSRFFDHTVVSGINFHIFKLTEYKKHIRYKNK